MQKSLISAVSILGLAFVLGGCKGGSGGGGGDTMATVNGEAISREEYISHLERKIQVLVQTQQGPVQAQVAQPLSFQGLNDLVNQKLLIQMAKEENVLPTDKDIQDEMTFQQTKQQNFITSLTAQGLTLNDIKGELLISLCRHNLLSKGIKISDAQVEAYIKEHPQAFENPPMVDLSWVSVKAEDKAAVDSELKAGQTFSVVATRRTNNSGGAQYPTRSYNDFPPRLKPIVDKLNENGTSDWLQDGQNYVKFHVEKKTPASKIEIKPWMKTMVQRSLAEQKGAAAVDLDKRLLELRKKANIVVTRPGLKDKFDQLSKTLKEADMKSTGGGATAKAGNSTPTPAPDAANN